MEKFWALRTLSMKRLNVVVINLKRSVASTSRESDDMIIVIADFHPNLAQRQIVRSDIEHYEDISLNLCARRRGF